VENQVSVSEIWSYHSMGDQTRFTLVHRSAASSKAVPDGDAPRRRENGRPDVAANAKKTAKRPPSRPAPKKKTAPAKKPKRK
jgi:hypothetical protein